MSRELVPTATLYLSAIIFFMQRMLPHGLLWFLTFCLSYVVGTTCLGRSVCFLIWYVSKLLYISIKKILKRNPQAYAGSAVWTHRYITRLSTGSEARKRYASLPWGTTTWKQCSFCDLASSCIRNKNVAISSGVNPLGLIACLIDYQVSIMGVANCGLSEKSCFHFNCYLLRTYPKI